MAQQRAPSLDRALALTGLIVALLYVADFTVAGVLRAGYSPIDQAVSDLGVGDNAWLLNSSLILLGLGLSASAIAFWRHAEPLTGGILRTLCSVLLAAVGIGFAIAGLFPETDPIHWELGAPLVFFGAPVAFLLSGIIERRGPTSRGWGTLSLLIGLATLVSVGATFYVFSSYQYPAGGVGSASAVGQYGGLMERLVFVVILTWYVVFGWRVSQLPRRGVPWTQ